MTLEEKIEFNYISNKDWQQESDLPKSMDKNIQYITWDNLERVAYYVASGEDSDLSENWSYRSQGGFINSGTSEFKFSLIGSKDQVYGARDMLNGWLLEKGDDPIFIRRSEEDYADALILIGGQHVLDRLRKYHG